MRSKRKLLLTAAFTALLGFGAFAGVSFTKDASKPVEVAEAANWASGNTVYIRIFKSWVDTGPSTVYVRYNSSAGWKNYSPTGFSILGGDNTYYYYYLNFANAPTSDIYVKRYDSKPDDSSDAAWNTCALSKTYTSNLIAIDHDDNWNYGYYCGSSICNYHFQSPTNGSVTVSVKDSGNNSKGNASLNNEDNYIYSDWKVTLTASANSGYGFSHWTESSNGSTYYAWSGSDIRTNPKTNMTNMSGNVYHGAVFKQYRTIYYISGEDYETTNRIYAWTNYATSSGNVDVTEFGSYDSCWAITAAGGTELFSDGVVHFNGSTNKIYKISLFSDNFLLRNSDGTDKTGDFVVADGSGYYWDGANANAGAAITLIVDAETARNNVHESGSIKDYSICGISKSTASSLVLKYNSLDSGARTLVDASTVYTYKGDGTSAQTHISFSAIFDQLSKIASGSNSLKITLFGSLNDSASTTIIVIAISSIALAAIGGYFLFRKKKEN